MTTSPATPEAEAATTPRGAPPYRAATEPSSSHRVALLGLQRVGADEVARNRDGALSAAQRRRVLLAEVAPLVVAAGALVAGAALVLAATLASADVGAHAARALLALALGGPGLLALSHARARRDDLDASPVRACEGALQKSRYRGAGAAFVTVGERTFAVDERLFGALSDGERYRVYYLELYGSREAPMVAIEPV